MLKAQKLSFHCCLKCSSSILLLQDLQLLMDPSRNMSRYRNLFNGERAYPPLVSPVVDMRVDGVQKICASFHWFGYSGGAVVLCIYETTLLTLFQM